MGLHRVQLTRGGGASGRARELIVEQFELHGRELAEGVIDVLVSTRWDAAAAREFFAHALRFRPLPAEVTTDRVPVYPRVVEEICRRFDMSASGMRTTAWKPITVA